MLTYRLTVKCDSFDGMFTFHYIRATSISSVCTRLLVVILYQIGKNILLKSYIIFIAEESIMVHSLEVKGKRRPPAVTHTDWRLFLIAGLSNSSGATGMCYY